LKELDISLRELVFDDWKAVHEYASQEKACIYQPWGPNRENETKAYVSTIIQDAMEVPRTRFAFAVTVQDGSKVIGAGDINIRDVENRSGEISYIINPVYWGKGYATETAKQLLEFGFNILKLHRIYATCDPRNVASSRVLEKIGMKYEGRMREVLLIRDGWRDSSLYSILEDEWNIIDKN
jgi:RimJ/RimL family protein N-acetyltransferase